VTTDTATVYADSVEILNQSFTSLIKTVEVNTSDLQSNSPARYRIVVHDQTQADNTGVLNPTISDPHWASRMFSLGVKIIL
jgi:hypothetical protein